MSNPDFRYPIREPTGLGLGTFDVYLIRQKLYDGEFHARCEFQTADGQWHPVTAHPAFSEVVWLVGGDKKPGRDAPQRRAIGAGWKVQGEQAATKKRATIRLDKDAPLPATITRDDKKGGNTGLLGRFFGGKK